MPSTRKRDALIRFFHHFTGESGTAILFVLVVAVICSLVVGAVSFASRFTVKKSGMRREKVAALNIAEAGKERFYAKLLHEDFNPSSNADTCIYDNESFGDGFYSVRCSTGADPTMMTIRALGKEGANTVNLEILAAKRRSIPIPGMAERLPGTIMARANVDLKGNIDVDGRDYDSLNNLVGPGQYGVYTCLSMDINGSAAVGGNNVAPVDKKDIDPVRSTVCYENAAIVPELASPEAFLGLPDGSLDDYKIPPEDFSVPFKGLIYVTGSIGPVHFGESRGILIVHNATNTATLQINQGNFKGLIICDVMDKINGVAEIIGAVVTLSTTTASTFGNGDADLHYSAQVLDNLNAYCENLRWRIEELSWREVL
ncbi:MAG: hypothetical protein JXA18_16570 [Chitinispirillaceae bacterium]|nr:hypothetical protein [Chitinispirillaceae bacterium]